ncbi:MAG TPA: hypothetical protein VKX17_16060 [Planctomycetota bacterium]|nr:hypothetical protein [Planctomycetota bacterium]
MSILTPSALWLIAPALLLLILFRLLRARRRVIVAGSLLIWNRLALLPVTTRPKRIIFDRSLLLQIVAILALIAALSQPVFTPRESNARTILIVLDNGPLARSRTADGRPLLENVAERARELLNRLDSRDRIYIAQTAPLFAVLNEKPFSPRAAADTIATITPALSGPDPNSIWLLAADRARAIGNDGSVQIALFSLRDNPQNTAALGNNSALWVCASDEAKRLDNIAIVEAGSIRVTSKANPGARVLVRLSNFSASAASGEIKLESLENSAARELDTRAITMDAGKEAVASFSISDDIKTPLRLTWRSATNSADALPEDDSVVLAPRPAHAPRVRFHAPQAALEDLFRYGLDAQIVSDENGAAQPSKIGAIDLDVYVGSVPDRLPDDAHAAFFVAPERGYHSFFDVGEVQSFKQPIAVQRGDDDALTAEIAAGANMIAIPRAVEIMRTGDFKTLLREPASGRALAAKFIDEKSRPCYLLAFSPGDGLPSDWKLDKPLAAMLTRMALEAARGGPPYTRVTAAELEAASGRPLPLEWRPRVEESPQTGSGVLSESTSELKTGAPVTNASADVASFLAAHGSSSAESFDFSPWLIALGLLCAGIEFFCTRA